MGVLPGFILVDWCISVVGNVKNSLFGTWWCQHMEAFSALQALCAGNSPVNGEFPFQRASKADFDVSFDMGPQKLLKKLSKDRWFETTRRSCDVILMSAPCSTWFNTERHWWVNYVMMQLIALPFACFQCDGVSLWNNRITIRQLSLFSRNIGFQ